MLAGAGVRSSRVLAGALRRATRGRRPRAPLARREASAPTSYSTVSGYLHDVERFSVSLRGNRLSGLWSLTGALTSHIVLHFLRFSETFRGESRQIDRQGIPLSIFRATNPGFPETVTLGV